MKIKLENIDEVTKIFAELGYTRNIITKERDKIISQRFIQPKDFYEIGFYFDKEQIEVMTQNFRMSYEEFKAIDKALKIYEII